MKVKVKRTDGSREAMMSRTSVVRRAEVDETADDVVVVDRSTPHGNRFTHDPKVIVNYRSVFEPIYGSLQLVPDRAAAVEAHRVEFLERLGGPEAAELRAWLRSIRGKRLACHCHPLPCHADTYAELADMDEARLDRLVALYAGVI